MKTVIASTVIGFALVGFAQSAALSVGTNVALPGSTITYTTMNIRARGDGLENTNNSGTVAMITFSDFVDFTISNHSSGGRALFDNNSGTSIPFTSEFVGDAGTWSYTAGGVAIPAPTIAGSTIEFEEITSGWPNSVDDWGSTTIQGVKKITWTTDNASNFEPFSFDAVASTIPEPSSALLVLLGSAALMIRRRS